MPFGIAYGVSARGVGLDVVETQLMSLVVFSATAQLGVLSLLSTGAPVGVLIGTAMALNLQLLLLGLSIGRQMRLSWAERLAAASLLTDGAYAVAAAQQGPMRLPVLYAAAGFRLVHEEPHHSFGHDLVGETWELKL